MNISDQVELIATVAPLIINTLLWKALLRLLAGCHMIQVNGNKLFL